MVAARTSRNTRSRSRSSDASSVRIGLPVDLDEEERLERPARFGAVGRGTDAEHPAGGVAFDAHDRVHDEMEAEIVPFQFHRDRVDEEGHVVVHDLDDGVARVPAVFALRCEHADDCNAGGAPLREIPVRAGRDLQRRRGAPLEILERDLREVARVERVEVFPKVPVRRVVVLVVLVEALVSARFTGIRHASDPTPACTFSPWISRNTSSSRIELADRADAITMPRFRASDLEVTTKPDLTPVSEADHAVELALRRSHRGGDESLGHG